MVAYGYIRKSVMQDQTKTPEPRQHELGILGDADLTERVREVQDALERLESRAVAADLPDAIDWDGDDPRAVNAILRAAWEYVEMDEQQRPRRAAWRFPVPA